jgi:pantoate--beta-alanine ligase
VASIFVNRLQFEPGGDFERYPRTLERDCRVLEKAGCDVVFAPDEREMYPEPQEMFVTPPRTAEELCGLFRPGHFQGVATVVLKLLHLVRPDAAYFGRKDAQQLAVIRRMVTDLAVPVETRAVDTVREPDGLALSSRNALLSPAERRRAPSLHRALRARDPARCEGDLDYLAVVDPDTFREVPPRPGALVIGAARFGAVRLIDNIRIEEP